MSRHITFTIEELKALSFVVGNGYGGGDIFEDGLLDKEEDQEAFLRASEKIEKAINGITEAVDPTEVYRRNNATPKGK